MKGPPRTTTSKFQPGASFTTHPASYFSARLTGGISSLDLDRLKIVLVRSGQAELHGSFGVLPVRAGDLVLIPPAVEYGGVIKTPGDLIGGAFDLILVLDQIRWAIGDDSQDRRAAMAHFESLLPTIRTLHPRRSLRHDLERDLLALLHAAPVAHVKDRVIGAAEFLWQVGMMFDPLIATGRVLRGETIHRPLRLEVQLAIGLLQHDLAHDWGVAELATQVHLSPSTLHRAFKSELGVAPMEYLALLRAARYKQLITTSAMPFSEATVAVGWQSPDHARRRFRELNGVSQREHRSRSRHGLVPLR